MTIHYIANPAAGLEDGTSWTDAAAMSDFNTIYQACAGGDEIWIASTASHLRSFNDALIGPGTGTSESPIIIRGMRPNGTVQGYPEKALLYGTRTQPWPTTGGDNVSKAFRIGDGCQHTHFKDLVLMNYENGIYVEANINGIQASDMQFINVDNGFTTHGSYSPSNIRLRRCEVIGFDGRAFGIGGYSNDVVFEDCAAYNCQYDDYSTSNAPFGFMFDQNAYNIRVRRCISVGGFDVRPDVNYWQGDGFNVEEGCYDVTFEDCYASDWGDGGWDLKSSNTKLIRCVAERCKRNFRFHYQRIAGKAGYYDVVDCVSRYPRYRGGTGENPTHIQVSNGVGNYRTLVNWYSSDTSGSPVAGWTGSTGWLGSRALIEDHSDDTIIVDCAGTLTHIRILDTLIRRHPSSTLVSGTTTTTDFGGCITEEEE